MNICDASSYSLADLLRPPGVCEVNAELAPLNKAKGKAKATVAEPEVLCGIRRNHTEETRYFRNRVLRTLVAQGLGMYKLCLWLHNRLLMCDSEDMIGKDAKYSWVSFLNCAIEHKLCLVNWRVDTFVPGLPIQGKTWKWAMLPVGPVKDMVNSLESGERAPHFKSWSEGKLVKHSACLILNPQLSMFDRAFLDIPLVMASKPDGTQVFLATVRDNRSYVNKYSLEDELNSPMNKDDEDTTEWGVSVPTIDQVLATNTRRSQAQVTQTKGVSNVNWKHPLGAVSKTKGPRKEIIVSMPPSDDEIPVESRIVRPLPRRPIQSHTLTPQRPVKRARPNTADESPDFTYHFIEDFAPPVQQHQRHISDAVPTRPTLRPSHSRQASHGVLRNMPMGLSHFLHRHPAPVVPHGPEYPRNHVRFAENQVEDNLDMRHAQYYYDDKVYGAGPVAGPSRRH